MESLFTNSPVHETMEYIISEIYVVSKISKLCSKLIFKLLLLKLTTENTFMLNSKFFNSNHPNIKYTIERDPDKLLDTKIFQENGIMSTEVNRKDWKLPVHWTSKIPNQCKRNSITSDLSRVFHILSCVNDKISKTRQKFLNTDYPLRFINSVIKQFNDKLSEKSHEEDD